MGHNEEMIQKAIAQENGKVHVNAQSIPEKYQQKSCSFISTGLPSTSPANAACSLEQLIAEWSLIKPYLL